MACSEKTMRFMMPIWSDGTTTASFVPLFRIRPAQWKQIRLSCDLESIAANPEYQRAWRGSNDGGMTFGLVSQLGTRGFKSASGWDWSTEWVDASNDYQMIEIGVYVRNLTGAAKSMAQLGLVVDLRGS